MKYLLLIFLDPTHFWDSRWGRGPVDAKEVEVVGERNIYRGTPLEGFQDATPRSVAPNNQTNQNQSNLDNQVNQGNFGFHQTFHQGSHVNQGHQRR